MDFIMKNKFLALGVTLLLVGCASKLTPNSQYETLIAQSQLKKVESIQEGVQTSYIRNLELDTLEQDYLSQTDDIVSNDNYLSYYVVYKFKPQQTSTYRFSIKSLPFVNKGVISMFKPKIIMLDRNMQILPMDAVKDEEKRRTLTQRHRFTIDWQNTLEKDEEYYVWLQSDNAHIGNVTQQYSTMAPIGLPGGGLMFMGVDHSIYLGAIGKFELQVTTL